MSGFELLGATADETRMLVHRETGYSIPVPGHPHVIEARAGMPVYGALVAMTDLPIELGWRLDTLPTSVEPKALAIALATAYSGNRAGKTVGVTPMIGTFLPKGATAGARCVYQLPGEAADSGEVAMEQLEVSLRARETTVEAMYYTARFEVGGVNPIKWAHFRTAVAEHQRWDGPHTTPPRLWPESALAFSSVKLELTATAFEEAQAKAESLGGITPEENAAAVKFLLRQNDNDMPPLLPFPSLFPPMIRSELRAAMPSGASEILLANLDQVKTVHDLRAWLWQQIWALGNRASVVS